jgi:Fe-S cluster biosynthesis and repair protein YggX
MTIIRGVSLGGRDGEGFRGDVKRRVRAGVGDTLPRVLVHFPWKREIAASRNFPASFIFNWSTAIMVRMVQCAKLGKELPGLEKPPFPGELGQKIYENISAEAYSLWLPHMTILINHYALNPADPETRAMMRKEMDAFFFGEQPAVETENLTPPTHSQNGVS